MRSSCERGSGALPFILSFLKYASAHESSRTRCSGVMTLEKPRRPLPPGGRWKGSLDGPHVWVSTKWKTHPAVSSSQAPDPIRSLPQAFLVTSSCTNGSVGGLVSKSPTKGRIDGSARSGWDTDEDRMRPAFPCSLCTLHSSSCSSLARARPPAWKGWTSSRYSSASSTSSSTSAPRHTGEETTSLPQRASGRSHDPKKVRFACMLDPSMISLQFSLIVNTLGHDV